MANAWFIYALSSAIIWGFSYALSEKILKDFLSPYFYMVFSGFFYFTISMAICLYVGHFKDGMQMLLNNKDALLWASITSICYVVGALLIYLAISEKNATMANFIEISYPFFTFLFAWLLFKDVQLNIYTAIGSLFVVLGVGIIFLKS